MIRHFRIWLLLIYVLTAFVGTAQTFDGQGGLLVPPGAPLQTVGVTTSTATVSGIGILGEGCSIIDYLTLDFNHTWDGDVGIFLIAPSGQVLELSTGNGGSGDNFIVTVFTDFTTPFITTGAPPFNGTFRPEGRQTNTTPPFFNTNPPGTFTFASTFNGVNADGDWTLFINDHVALDVGVLNSWSLTFSVGGGPAPEVTLGPDITICPGQSTTLIAEVDPGADTYMWSTGQTSSSITVSPNVTTLYSVTVTNNDCIDADTIEVFVDPDGITANAGPDVAICDGASTTLTGSGGSTNATYAWSNGQNGPVITVSPATTTTYTLTVTDGGCSDTDQVVVTVNAIPNADAGPDISICEGQSTSLTATGGFQGNHYLWSTGQNGSTINVNPINTTTYTVTVTVNGCSDTDNVTVTVNDPPTVDAGPDVQICEGESTTLSADGSGGTYQWSTGQSGSDITVSPSNTTTYSVTVTQNGCTATDNVTVTVGEIVAGISPDQSICEGTSITLVATGGTDYEWSTGQSGSTITVSPTNTTTYSVTVTQGSCFDEADVTITVNDVPIVTVSPDQVICAGTSVTLTASGGSTYSWNIGQNSSSISVTPNSTTLYTVTVTDAGCSSSASVEVFVNPTPNANAGADESICSGDEITLTADGLSGPGTYEWSTGETGASIIVEPINTTTYTVTITNEWDCEDIDQVIVTVNPIPFASAGPDQDLCDGMTTTLTATGESFPFNYEWSTGESGSSILVSPTLSTTYTVTVEVDGCSSTDDVEVTVLAAPVASAGADQEACAGTFVIITATGGGTYQWSTGQITQTIDVIPTSTTTYTVTVTSANTCTDTDDITVTVNPVPQANAGPDQAICLGESATLEGSGGNTYDWSTGDDVQIISVAPVGTTTYSLTVTDNNGCSDVDQVSVVVNQIPIANAGPNVFIISGESTVLTASGGGTYLWSTGESSDQISIMPAGTTTYSVTVTLNGCVDVDEVTVFVDEAPSVDLGPDIVICNGESATIDATISGPFDMIYVWSDGTIDPIKNVSPTSSTTYIVTATDQNSGLFSIDSIDIIVLNLPLGTPAINGPLSLCTGSSATYTVNPVSGAETYTWTVPTGATIMSGQGTTSIEVDWNNSTGGNIDLEVANSCGSIPTVSIQITINQPPILLGPIIGQADPCAAGSSTYTISPVADADNYQWSIAGGGSISSGQNTNQVTIDWNNSSGGDVCVIATNECGSSLPECITVATSTTPTISAGTDQEVCGFAATLTGAGTGTWTLLNGPGSATITSPASPGSDVTVLVEGVFEFEYAISQNGCIAADTSFITFKSNPSIINTITNCNSSNTEYSVSFDISGGQSPFQVNGNSIPGNFFNSAPLLSGTSYSFQVTDANGCLSQDISDNVLCLCSTEAGQMDLSPLDACIEDTLIAIYLGGEIIDGNDTLAFILHDGNIPAGIIYWNTLPEFQFISPMIVGTTYFISAIVGDKDANDLPDLTDPCLAISEGTPVRFHNPPIAYAGEDQTIGCSTNFVSLDAAGSSTGNDIKYFWTTIGGSILGTPDTDQINVSGPGLYILSVRNTTSGCISFDTIRTISNSFTFDPFEIIAASPICFGDCNGTIQINTTAQGFLFDYGDGNFLPDTEFNNVCSGSLLLSVMDTLGCTIDTTIIIPSPEQISVNLGPDKTINVGDSLALIADGSENVVQYNWFSASKCTSCPAITVLPTASGPYVVGVSDINNCSAFDTILISLIQPENIFIPTVFSPNGDQQNDIFFIQGSPDLEEIESLQIFDRWGNQVFELNDFPPGDPIFGWDGFFQNTPVSVGVFVYLMKAKFAGKDPVQFAGDITLIR